MRKFLLFIITIFVTVSCKKSETPYMFYNPQITVTYFTGTSLNSFFRTNINDAKAAIETGILKGGGRYFYSLPKSSTTADLYEIKYSNGKCVETLISTYTNFESLSEGSLTKVIDDVKNYTNFDVEIGGKPQRMNLVLSGHGTGWISHEVGSFSSIGSAGSTESEWENPDALYPTRYMGAGSDGFMEISELATELNNTGIKFGYILFDECFMSNVELQYRIKDYADYIIASPCEIMAAGFPYEEVMPRMFSTDECGFDLLGICEAYYDYYSNGSNNSVPCGCVAVCVTSELDELAAAQSTLSFRELSSSEIYSLQKYEGRVNDPVFFDLKQYVNLAADGSSPELLDAYNAQFDRAYPEQYRLHTEYFYTNIGTVQGKTKTKYYSGVTTSAPTTGKYRTTLLDEPWTMASQADNAGVE